MYKKRLISHDNDNPIWLCGVRDIANSIRLMISLVGRCRSLLCHFYTCVNESWVFWTTMQLHLKKWLRWNYIGSWDQLYFSWATLSKATSLQGKEVLLWEYSKQFSGMEQIVTSEWLVTGLISYQDKTLFIEIPITCVVRCLALASFKTYLGCTYQWSMLKPDKLLWNKNEKKC